ncbi:hypothetical protein FACS1894195_1880 [Bacteroidia bacterium]|nr:hypothetical protein FACS1894195_1880 [Bacteroidia bacterium]
METISYNSLDIKQIGISVKNDEQTTNLYGSLKIKKDEFIWLSVSIPPFGIEVARMLITPDSVKVLDQINKEFLETDFSYLSKTIGFPLNFKVLQNVLSGVGRSQSSELLLKSDTGKEELKVTYSDFKDYEGTIFPETITLSLSAYSKKREVLLKFSKIEFNTDIAPNFKLTSKYKPSNLLK